jgi:catecholate siderophore receptor
MRNVCIYFSVNTPAGSKDREKVKARNESFRLNSVFVAVCGALMVAPVMAQTPIQSASPGVSSLPTIPVEASAEGVPDGSLKADRAANTKFVAPLLDTPKTVSVITQEMIKETNATTLQEVLRGTPGITFGMGEGGTPEGDHPFIRGFDSINNVLIDGVRDPSSQSRDMFNVERVDVTKGADSVYNGGGAVGGSINLVQKAPSLENSIGGSLGLGTDKYKRATVDLNRQLGETSAFRLNVLGAKGDVAGRNDVDYEHLGIAPTFAFGLGTPTRVTVGYYHYETDDMPDYGIPYNNPYTAGTANARFNGDGGPLGVSRDNFYGLKGRDFRKTQVDSGTLKVEHDINERFTVSNTTRYTESSNDYVASNPGDTSGLNITNAPITVGTLVVPPGFLNRSAKSRNSESQGFINATQLRGKVDTGGFKHSLAMGVEFAQDKVNNRGYTVGAAPVANILNPNPNDPYTGTITRATSGTRTQAESKSVYIFDALELNPQWSINAGLRYDSYDTHASPYSTIGAPLASNTFLRSKNDFLNYQAGIVYKPAPNGSVYLNYATASNQPGVSVGDGTDSLALTNQDLDAERVKSLELGAKWDVLDRRLALTGAIFHIEKTNAKVSTSATTVENVGEQRVNGIELGFAGNISPAWKVFGGYVYQDAKLTDAGPVNAAFNGNQFPNTAKNSASLWTSYKVMPQLTLGGGVYYVDKVWGNTNNTKFVPSYVRLDAYAEYEINKNVSLQLNVQNLADKRYFDRAFTTHMVSVAPGRLVTVTANFKY